MPNEFNRTPSFSLKSKFKQSVLFFLRTALSQVGRNKEINLKTLLISPCCHTDIVYNDEIPSCTKCANAYKKTQGLYNFCT